jgi:hypothetical protein
MYGIHRQPRGCPLYSETATLSINDRVYETLGITIELKMASEAINFIKQVSSTLAYGENSVVKI